MSSANKIGKQAAHNLQGVADNLLTDTKRIIARHGKVMQEVYEALLGVVPGRELDHVEYLFGQYRRALRKNEATEASAGTVGQICAAVVRLITAGKELPDTYTAARAMAYPPKPKKAAKGAEDSGESEAEANPAPSPATPADRVAACISIINAMDLDELTTLMLYIDDLARTRAAAADTAQAA